MSDRLRPTLAVITLLITLPLATAVPDGGLSRTIDQVFADNPLIIDELPCQEESVVWSGLDQPIVRGAILAAGDDICRGIMIHSAVQTALTTQLGSAELRQDGQLTIRLVLPLVRTPVLVPFRNQDLNSTSFTEDAVRDLQSDPARWMPYMLDPNKDVPCLEGLTGVPREVALSEARTSIYAKTCEGPALEPSRPVDLHDGVRSDLGSVAPPRRIATIERIFLLQVEGFAPDGQRIYSTAFANVALVDNAATETMGGLQEAVEANGTPLKDVTFHLRAFLSEAQLAAGRAIPSTAHALIPRLPLTETGLILDLPDPPSGGLPTSSNAFASSEANGGDVDACDPIPTQTGVLLTASKGCVHTMGRISDPGTGYTYDVLNGYYERHLIRDQWLVLIHVEDSTSINIPSYAGVLGYTKGQAIAEGPQFQAPGSRQVRVTTIWEITGEVERLCDPGGEYCAAGSADLQIISLAAHRKPGEWANTAAYRTDTPLYAAPLIVCAPEVPLAPQFYEILQPLVGCFLPFLYDGYDHHTQGFQKQVITTEMVVDVQQYPGWITPMSNLVGIVSDGSTTRLGSVDVYAKLLGFHIEKVS